MFHATTIVVAKKGDHIAMAGDGQVTLGQATVMKHNARKVRRLFNGQVLAGFAGSVADAFTLFDKFETKLTEYHGNLQRSAVELTKEWRTDKMLRNLEAMLLVANKECVLLLSGSGEVIEPDDGIAAIGSGGNFALAAARALAKHSDLPAGELVKESLLIASSICVYTNDHIIVEEI